MSSGNDIKFIDVVRVLESIEATTQRTVMAKLLSSLLKKSPPDVIDKVIYFILGQLRPDWEGVELGVAEKFTFRSIANATGGASVKQVEDLYKKLGDIGETAKRIMSSKPQQGGGKSILDFFGGGGGEELTMGKVYDTLMSIARASGEGAQDTKVKLLTYLFSRAKPEEAKYIARFVIGKLRLGGVADMTILDALSDAYKVPRDALERAYHIYPDLGYIAKMVAREGQNALAKIHVTPGVPIQPMLAERLSTASEILAKLGGVAMVEYKYDGERAQVHRTRDGEVRIFSRRLENITYAYPDVAEYVKEAIDAKEFIVEGEIIAIDPDTGEFRPFQELMHRKRKHDIKEAMKEYPVNIFLFDTMYVDGQDLTNLPLIDRKRKLLEILKPSDYVHLATWRVINDAEELDKFFHEAISDGCEGVMCKSIKADSVYEMGARGLALD